METIRTLFIYLFIYLCIYFYTVKKIIKYTNFKECLKIPKPKMLILIFVDIASFQVSVALSK